MKALKRPFIIRTWNKLNIPFRLEVDDLIHRARRKTGLSDFGNEDFITPLRQLIHSIHKDARLHSFGQFITRERLVNILMNRLRVEELFRKHPEINDIEINAPIIITGLQRTGTTRLHRLLSAHPTIRSLQSWEALNPAPIPNDSDNKKRKAFAKQAEKALRFMAPDFFAIHPVEFQAPEEDILLNDMTFISTVPEATLYVPTYVEWLRKQNHLSAYQYLKKVLKLLTWQNPNQRWVLKTPQYLEFVKEAVQVFPDAQFIHTYRDPLKVIPSFCSMVYHGRWVFSDVINPLELSKHWLEKDVMMLRNALEYWDGNPTVQVSHISYHDMKNNYEKTIAGLMDDLSLEFGKKEKEIIHKMNMQNRQHKYGVHHYTLSDFGLIEKEVDAQFEFYRKRFLIPYE